MPTWSRGAGRRATNDGERSGRRALSSEVPIDRDDPAGRLGFMRSTDPDQGPPPDRRGGPCSVLLVPGLDDRLPDDEVAFDHSHGGAHDAAAVRVAAVLGEGQPRLVAHRVADLVVDVAAAD